MMRLKEALDGFVLSKQSWDTDAIWNLIKIKEEQFTTDPNDPRNERAVMYETPIGSCLSRLLTPRYQLFGNNLEEVLNYFSNMMEDLKNLAKFLNIRMLGVDLKRYSAVINFSDKLKKCLLENGLALEEYADLRGAYRFILMCGVVCDSKFFENIEDKKLRLEFKENFDLAYAFKFRYLFNNKKQYEITNSVKKIIQEQ